MARTPKLKFGNQPKASTLSAKTATSPKEKLKEVDIRIEPGKVKSGSLPTLEDLVPVAFHDESQFNFGELTQQDYDEGVDAISKAPHFKDGFKKEWIKACKFADKRQRWGFVALLYSINANGRSIHLFYVPNGKHVIDKDGTKYGQQYEKLYKNKNEDGAING